MNVTEIPFNVFLKIEKASDSAHLLQLHASPCHLNHVGTVHAGVQLTLAEAASGECLMRAFPELADKVVAVVRRVEAKFKKPMQGSIYSRASTSLEEIRRHAEPLAANGRSLIPVTIEVTDDTGTVGLVATIEWFAANRE